MADGKMMSNCTGYVCWHTPKDVTRKESSRGIQASLWQTVCRKPEGTDRSEKEIARKEARLSKERSGQVLAATSKKEMSWCKYQWFEKKHRSKAVVIINPKPFELWLRKQKRNRKRQRARKRVPRSKNVNLLLHVRKRRRSKRVKPWNLYGLSGNPVSGQSFNH